MRIATQIALAMLCLALLPVSGWAETGPGTRELSARELVEVRDLSGVSIAPDQKVAAVRLERPRVESNDVELTWYVVPLDHARAPVKAASAGDRIFIQSGVLATETPQWSPDSQWFYYRKLQDQQVQIWRTRRDSTRTERLTGDEADIENFVLDGDRIFYVVRATRAAILAAEREEYENGVLLDGSVMTLFPVVRTFPVNGRMATLRRDGGGSRRTTLLGSSPSRVIVHDIKQHSAHPANDEELASFKRFAQGTVKIPGAVEARQAPMGGAVAFLRREDHKDTTRALAESLPDYRVQVADSSDGANPLVCASESCLGRVTQLRWNPETNEVVFLRTSFSQRSIYAWNVRTNKVRVIVDGDDDVSSVNRFESSTCPIAAGKLICITASASAPPKLSSIDVKTGARSDLFDPNLELRRDGLFTLPERIDWQDASGIHVHGYLFLPRGGTAGGPYPLVITTYGCNGFLRGGTGDEYPEHLFTSYGIAAFCLVTPTPIFDKTPVLDSSNLNPTAEVEGLASIKAAIDLLTSRKLIDPRHVGLTGLSHGAEVTAYAVSHSDLFAAAAISSNTALDPSIYYLSGPLEGYGHRILTELYRLPSPGKDEEKVWDRLSPARNARQVKAPILMQLAESEYRASLEFFTSLREEKKSVELFIFPDEYHIKSQPLHRLAIYNRNLDWFRFWLLPAQDTDPAKARQYERWRKMRLETAAQSPG